MELTSPNKTLHMYEVIECIMNQKESNWRIELNESEIFVREYNNLVFETLIDDLPPIHITQEFDEWDNEESIAFTILRLQYSAHMYIKNNYSHEKV